MNLKIKQSLRGGTELKVLTLTPSYPRFMGDYHGRFIQGLCLRLHGMGVDIKVLAPRTRTMGQFYSPFPIRRYPYLPSPKMEMLAERTMKGAPLLHLLQLPPYMASAHIHMTAELTDIVHAHLAIPFGLLGSFNPRHTPLVVTCHGSDCTLPFDRPIFRPLVEKTLHRADRVVAVSKYVMDLAIRLGAHPEKVEVIYIGVDTSLFMPPRDRPSLKAAAGLPEHVPVIGVLGRLVPEKRIGDVLRAASRVSRKSDIHVLVGGDGPQRRHLEALASKQGMDNVSFLGAVSDAARFHSLCDVFALASTREGLSYSLQEAMATGCVPVTVDGCGCPEIVSAGDNGYLFKPGNIEDLAEKMLMAVENPWLGLRARGTVEERFDIDENSLRYVELYRQMTSSA